MARSQQKRIDDQFKWKLEMKIGRQHPYWNMGQVWAQVELEVAKIKARKSLRDLGMDASTIAAIEYIGSNRGETATEVIAWAIDAQFRAQSNAAVQRILAEVIVSPEGMI